MARHPRVLLCTVALAAALGAIAAGAGAVSFVADPAWLTLPEGRTEIGSMHGEIAVSAAGEVYISVEGTVRQRYAILGPNPGLQVYAPDGRFLRNVPDAPFDFHGFLIRREADGEYIYGARLAGGPTAADQTRDGLDQAVIVKMTLDGKPVLRIPASAIPDQFKNKANDGGAYMRLTGIAVAPNGDIYVTDGYASDYVHRFDKSGRYVASFGGKQPPYGFRTLHRVAIDPRFQPARLIATDRENGRLVHLSLDGQFLGVIKEGMLRPASIAISGDLVAVGELRGGRVSVLDKTGATIVVLGENPVEDDRNNNRTEPSHWKPGIFTAPHGLAFDAQGNLFVSEFNLFGRVHRFTRGPS
jgi:DNA-binding beta-propeller fold protein YncE